VLSVKSANQRPFRCDTATPPVAVATASFMNVASARPIRQPCGKVQNHRPRECCLPAGAGEKGIERLAVRVTHGTSYRPGGGAPDFCKFAIPLARISPPCPRGDPNKVPSGKRQEKGISFVSLGGHRRDNARREWCASSASLRDTDATKREMHHGVKCA
jgi:hypothetical protein